MADPEAQAVVDAPEQQPEPESEPENPLAALEAPDAAPPADDASEPEPDVEATPEPSTPDVGSFLAENLTGVLEHEDVQKAIKQAAADAANEARQAEQKRISLEAGADERVAQAVEGVLTAAGVTTTDLTNPQVTAMRAAFASQSQFQAFEQAKKLAAAMIDRHPVSGDTLNDALESWNAGDPGSFAHSITGAVVESAVTAAKADWDKERDAEVARLVQGELDARSKQTTNESPPDAPAGVAAGLGPSPQEYGAATPEQRAQWNTDGVEVRIPTA